MDLDNIKKIVQNFSDERDWNQFHSPKNLVMALSGEVGELNEIFQWLTEEESQKLPQAVHEHTKEEVADIAIYLLRICMKLDIDLEEAILSKMDKNAKKYPIKKAKGNAKKYNDFDS